ncbi:MAG: YeeE/YedE family protein [Deltaproteobacteria bacterium]|nr:YeeE/YedE family protein [Deltaproteobacteria bacterium]
MDHSSFTPLMSLAGGALIGLSATVLLLANGRIAGISGIYASAITGGSGPWQWRWLFLAGLLMGGALLFGLMPAAFAIVTDRPLWAVAVAGLLVGVGTRYGSGCTSGHGVCGMSRLSKRSFVATMVFIITGAATVAVARLLGGAA